MTYEVENKYRIESANSIEDRLAELGCQFAAAVTQRDEYFNHPSRDFAETDEALRIRSVGDENRITYKGPKLDTATKTRKEIEPLVGPGGENADLLASVLIELGFRRVRVVEKRRRTANFLWETFPVEAALDEVTGLGSFLELEISADDENLQAAQAGLNSLANHLGLSTPERRSYLELLLAGG